MISILSGSYEYLKHIYGLSVQKIIRTVFKSYENKNKYIEIFTKSLSIDKKI